MITTTMGVRLPVLTATIKTTMGVHKVSIPRPISSVCVWRGEQELSEIIPYERTEHEMVSLTAFEEHILPELDRFVREQHSLLAHKAIRLQKILSDVRGVLGYKDAIKYGNALRDIERCLSNEIGSTGEIMSRDVDKTHIDMQRLREAIDKARIDKCFCMRNDEDECLCCQQINELVEELGL